MHLSDSPFRYFIGPCTHAMSTLMKTPCPGCAFPRSRPRHSRLCVSPAFAADPMTPLPVLIPPYHLLPCCFLTISSCVAPGVSIRRKHRPKPLLYVHPQDRKEAPDTTLAREFAKIDPPFVTGTSPSTHRIFSLLQSYSSSYSMWNHAQ